MSTESNVLCTFTHHNGGKVQILIQPGDEGETYVVQMTEADGTITEDVFEDAMEAQQDFLETLKIFI